MKNEYKILILMLLTLFTAACDKEKPEKNTAREIGLKYDGPQVELDLAAIRERGVLRGIAIYNSTGYFLYRGEPMGFEYELLRHYANYLDVELEMVVANNVNELFDLLNSGKGDIIASGLTVTEPRKDIVSFTDYYYVTHQVLVQRMPDNWRRLPRYKIDRQLVSDVIELIGDTVRVHERSSYFERLQNLEQEIGGVIHIDTAVGVANSDDLIQDVVNGDAKYTVADYNIAAMNKTYYPILDIETPISFSQRIAWAVRKNSPALQQETNKWLAQMRKRDLFYVIYNKYFKNKKSYRRRVESDLFSRSSGLISPYDSLIQQYADSIQWDWRLLASQMYQESRFDPQAKSWAGAQGLMQIMPATGRDLGLKNPADPEQSIKAGVRYLDKRWENFDEIEDSIQRIKFVLAAYNCGLGHVQDARRLTEKYGKNPDKWDNNVEIYLRRLSRLKYYNDPVVRYGYVRGEEPYLYVKDIFRRYHHYSALLPQIEEEADSSSSS